MFVLVKNSLQNDTLLKKTNKTNKNKTHMFKGEKEKTEWFSWISVHTKMVFNIFPRNVEALYKSWYNKLTPKHIKIRVYLYFYFTEEGENNRADTDFLVLHTVSLAE